MENFSMASVKKKNYRDIFMYLYKHPDSAKQTIANELCISLPTVTQNLLRLLEQGLIVKNGQIRSAIGRKAVAYTIKHDAKVAIGLEVLKHEVSFTALDLYGKTMTQSTQKLEFSMTDEYYRAIGNAVVDFVSDSKIDPGQLIGVGMGIQGLISSDGSEVTYGEILHCAGLRAESFQQYIPYPFALLHDADCAAQSELWLMPDIKDATFLSLGRHLGSAVIIDGEVFIGKNGQSCTVEHMLLHETGEKCYCGQRGCAECYCAAKSLLGDDGSIAEFIKKKNDGDKAFAKHWSEFLENLSLLIHNAQMMLDGDVLLGGYMASYLSDADLEVLMQRIIERSSISQPKNHLIVGKCTSNVICTGAAIHFLESYFESFGDNADFE